MLSDILYLMDNNLKTVLIILLPFIIIFSLLVFSDNSGDINNQLLDEPENDVSLDKESTESQNNVDNLKESIPDMVIKGGKIYKVKLTTSEGDIVVKLDITNTPVTANNFVTLSQNKFYDNTIFHRTIKGFMIQGGDPTGTGAGGPGYNIPDEPVVGDYKRGVIAMANTGAPNSAGSQFFIMHQDNLQLPKNYVIFGYVESGLDAIDKIATAPVAANTMGEMSKPVNPVKILSTEVIEE